jgi:hypothetical protein
MTIQILGKDQYHMPFTVQADLLFNVQLVYEHWHSLVHLA